MRNIEMKAVLRNRNAAEMACRNLNGEAMGDIYQTDTYFRVSEGRLKLREATPGRNELIFYQRPDTHGPKGCDYLLAEVPPEIRVLLAESLGVLAVVEKKRSLYLWENVRIHLDEVKELGSFLEFEAVMQDGNDDVEGYRKLESLMEFFGVEPGDHLAVSYLDLMLEKMPSPAEET